MKSFKVQPYGQRIAVTSDPAAFVRRYNRSCGRDGDKMDLGELDTIRGMAAHLENSGKPVLFMLYLEPKFAATTLYHESLHMAHYVMEFTGTAISGDSSETQAYLMEHIAECAEKILK